MSSNKKTTLKGKLNYWQDLYNDAKSKRAFMDERIDRRNKLYLGNAKAIDRRTGGESKRDMVTFKKVIFEMIESQINNNILYPKITPRDVRNTERANIIESYLKAETDRLEFESLNDLSEREVKIQGTCFYEVGWDNSDSTHTTQGETYVKVHPLKNVYPQPGISDFYKAEYLFVEELVSIREIKKLYGVDVPEGTEYKGMNNLITAWYYDDNGFVSRFGWIQDIPVFDEESYELRKFRTCSKCDTVVPQGAECSFCGGTKFKYKSVEEEFLVEDIISFNPETGEEIILANKGTSIPYYKLRQLPFVIRVNISSTDSIYGISDVDLLEHNQDSINKLLTKLEQNILKSSTFVFVPKGVKIPTNNDSVKVIPYGDEKLSRGIRVENTSTTIQQDIMLSNSLYQDARLTAGITESFQGQKDATAESAIAKQFSAQQSAGRIESKNQMKRSAYANIYKLLFKVLLAYCDEPRHYVAQDTVGSLIDIKFDRFSFLDGEKGNLYYNDRYLFSVDNASGLSTNREAMWREVSNNFTAGTFGNPMLPQTLLIYWTMMNELGYPVAKSALRALQEQFQGIPPELEQALVQNPEALGMLSEILSGQGQETDNVQNNEQ